ncbi:MAG: hypothetical protein WC661_02465 [Opitutaceae bacterium]|jgi:hypothetical protein
MITTQRRGIDRYTQLADLAPGVRRLISRSIVPLLVIFVLVTIFLAVSHSPGTVAFALIGGGACIVLSLWAHQGIGVPLLPMLAVQHLVAYALPIIQRNETALSYPESHLNHAGIEVLLFFVALSGGWRFGMQAFRPAPPVAHSLRLMALQGSVGLRRVGYGLIALTTGYSVLLSLKLMDIFVSMLPAGSDSLLNALVSAAGMCGFFVIALGIGSKEINPRDAGIFWVLFTFNCLLTSSALLLSASTSFVATVFIGLFWGSNRVPWRFTLIVMCALGFLSLGKFEMRERYWTHDIDFVPMPTLAEMPIRYSEWASASIDVLTAQNIDPNTSEKIQKKDNSLLSRVNNLQNLLFVIDAEDDKKIEPLYGATYTLIPPLLIPRILWPNKPRAHEGQVMLNVHFGRQDLVSSYRTYIAWGLLPEAVGNFGPYVGAILLGLALGAFIAWVENRTVNLPVLSLEGFLVFTLFLNMAASFEMVASVLITSIFQSLVPVALACWPFVYRTTAQRPVEDPR